MLSSGRAGLWQFGSSPTLRARRETSVAVSFGLVVLCQVLGCGKLTGIDDYAVGAPGPSVPPLPALPDSVRVAECEACAATECGDERTACLASAACRKLLECHGQCSDPACIFRCRDTLARSFAFDDYFSCVFGVSLFGAMSRQLGGTDSRCSGACGIGQNWDCTRRYYSDLKEPIETLEFRFHDACQIAYGPLSTFAGTEVAACSSIAQTGEPSGDGGCDPWSAVSGQGVASIELRGADRSGVLALRGDGQAYRIHYRYAPRSGHVDVVLIRRLCVDNVLPGNVAGYDPSLGMVAFTTYDCLGSLALGTRMELGSDAPVGERFYWADYGKPDATLQTGSRGGFVNVPAAHALELSAWIEGGDSKPVSRTTILVADGWITSAQMFPAPADQSL